jgi:hypothetical protein
VGGSGAAAGVLVGVGLALGALGPALHPDTINTLASATAIAKTPRLAVPFMPRGIPMRTD